MIAALAACARELDQLQSPSNKHIGEKTDIRKSCVCGLRSLRQGPGTALKSSLTVSCGLLPCFVLSCCKSLTS